MLALTEDAAEAIEGMLAAPGIPDGAGLRIAATMPRTDAAAVTGFQASLARSPDESDEVVEEGGARVFLEDTVVEFLDDKVLDAELVEDRVRFSLEDQR